MTETRRPGVSSYYNGIIGDKKPRILFGHSYMSLDKDFCNCFQPSGKARLVLNADTRKMLFIPCREDAEDVIDLKLDSKDEGLVLAPLFLQKLRSFMGWHKDVFYQLNGDEEQVSNEEGLGSILDSDFLGEKCISLDLNQAVRFKEVL